MSKTQTPAQIQRYLHNVVWTHMGRSTIGFVRVKDSAPASLGSGTLIRFGNITGVLTCAHVLEALLGEEEIGILCFPVRATQIQRLRLSMATTDHVVIGAPPWSESGQFFGRRSHSTVISAHRRVEQLIRSKASIGVSDQTCGVEDAIRRVEAALRTA